MILYRGNNQHMYSCGFDRGELSPDRTKRIVQHIGIEYKMQTQLGVVNSVPRWLLSHRVLSRVYMIMQPVVYHANPSPDGYRRVPLCLISLLLAAAVPLTNIVQNSSLESNPLLHRRKLLLTHKEPKHLTCLFKETVASGLLNYCTVVEKRS